MKKETVIAISLGIFLGIGVALIMVARTRQQETAKTKTISSETNITPKVSLTDNKYQLLEISQPQDSVIIDSETVKIRGKASKDSLIIIQSPIKEVIIKNSNVNFSSDFPLTDGENIIKVSAYPKDQSLRFQEKELKIYQLNEQRLTAVSPTGSTSSSESTPSSAVDRQIQNFKDKIANKVAEMEKKDKKALAGVIEKISSESIAFITNDDKTIDGKISEATTTFYQILSSGKKEIKLSDLEKGDFIIASGLISGDSITATYIYKDDRYIVKSGKITEINKDSYYLKILTSEKDNLIVDIETYSKIKIINIKNLEIEKTGFSKLKEGDSVHFVYKITDQEKEKNRFSCLTLLVIPQEYFIK